MSPVDAFIAERVAPEHREIAERVRVLMREAASGAVEEMRYGLPMWRGHGHIAYLSPNQKGITFGFPYGVHFDDPNGLLKGSGKHARHLRLRTLADADPGVLRGYIRQAVAWDTKQARDA